MSDSSEIKFWVGFSRVPGIGKAKLFAIKKYFGDLKEAWKGTKSDYIKAGIDEKTADNILTFRHEFSLDKEIEKNAKYNIDIITCESNKYPSLLKEIPDYPVLIYVRGELKENDATSIAIVGTRRSTAYGRQVTEELVNSLVLCNITIVSGLAKGIDSIAHKAAIEAKGRTIAVFACGLDVVYPPENIKLARDIIENGALISEFPIGTKPKAEYFPRRNRILSGLSRGVVVVECGEQSGALITANFAVEQNREVFAVPGNVFSPMSKGPNKLIQEGAKLVRSHLDIIEELSLSEVAQQLELKNTYTGNPIEMSIIKYISNEPMHVDDICRLTGLNASVVGSNLSVMELNGLVCHIGNMNYVLCNRLK
jgi:DNA processing protein